MLKQKTAHQQMTMSDLKKGNKITLGLNESSKNYHPLLKVFECMVISATNDRITIKPPIANSSKKRWIIKKSEIALLQVMSL